MHVPNFPFYKRTINTKSHPVSPILLKLLIFRTSLFIFEDSKTKPIPIFTPKT